MARVNFDDFWWMDSRLRKLGRIYTENDALAWVLKLLRLGQECYKHNGGGIPPHLYANEDFPQEMGTLGFLEPELKDGKLVVVGADEMFSWYLSSSVNGKKGNEKQRVDKENKALAPATPRPPRGHPAAPPPPLTLTPPLPLSSSLDLFPSPNTESLKNTENLSKPKKEKKPAALTSVSQLKESTLPRKR